MGTYSSQSDKSGNIVDLSDVAFVLFPRASPLRGKGRIRTEGPTADDYDVSLTDDLRGRPKTSIDNQLQGR